MHGNISQRSFNRVSFVSSSCEFFYPSWFATSSQHTIEAQSHVPRKNNTSQIQDGASAATATAAATSASTSNRWSYPSPSSPSSTFDWTFVNCPTTSRYTNGISAQHSSAKWRQSVGEIMECSGTEERIIKLDTCSRRRGENMMFYTLRANGFGVFRDLKMFIFLHHCKIACPWHLGTPQVTFNLYII